MLDNRKNDILNVSFRLMIQNGYKDTSLNEIVTTAGLTKGAFYYYFKSKDELFEEVVYTFFISFEKSVYKEMKYNSLQGFYHVYLSRFMRVMEEIGSFNNEKLSANYIGLILDAVENIPGYKKNIKLSRSREQFIWRKVICGAIEAGEIQAGLSSKQLARLFIASKDGLALRLIMENRLDDLYKELYQTFQSMYNEISGKNSINNLPNSRYIKK